MAEVFLENNLEIKREKVFKFLIFFIFIFFSFQSYLNQNQAEGVNYKIEESYVEVQQKSDFQIIPLTREEKNQEVVFGSFKIEDQYLVSDLPENEFLEKYSRLKTGFKDLKIKIEVDQPIFKKEKFYQPKNFFQKISSLLSAEKLPDYRLIKEIKDNPGKLETNTKFSNLNFKTVYEEKKGNIKQSLLLENNSDKEINFQISLINEINANQFSFNGEKHEVSDIPKFLSSEKSTSLSFYPEFGSEIISQSFGYDFSDLLNFNPEIWIFKKDLKSFLLVKVFGSIPANSSTLLDPFYTVSSTTESLAGAWSFQRKTWNDGARYWVSFYDGEGIKFWYSTSGIDNWAQNSEGNIIPDGLTTSNDFSINCDNANCFIVTAENDGRDYYIYARAAQEYPSISFTWSEAFQVTSNANSLENVHISRSLPDELIWLTYEESTLFSDDLYVQRSSGGNAIDSFETADLILDDGSETSGLTVPISSSSNYMLAVYQSGETLLSKYYDVSWSSATTIDYLDSTGLDDNFSVIYDDVYYNAHLLYNASGTSDNLIKYIYWDSNASLWKNNASSTLASSTQSDYASISYDRNGNTLYAFWINITATDEFEVRYTTADISGLEWQTSNACATSSGTLDNFTWLTSNYFPYADTENDLFFQYMRTQSGWYDINFYKIDGAEANAAPTIGTVILNSGSNITLTENTTILISATTTVNDTDAYSDIASVNGVIYRSGVGSSCASDDNNCYTINSCATSSCSGNSCIATCQANIWFHANPTDAVSPYALEDWKSYIKVTDNQNASSSATSSGVELNTLPSLDLSYLYERYNTGDDSYSAVGGTTWAAQTFTIGNTGIDKTHNIINTRLKLGRNNSPGNGILSVKTVDINGAPTGTDLTSVTFNANNLKTSGEWVNLSLPYYELSAGTKYALVLRAPSGNPLVNSLSFMYDGTSPTYSSGSCYVSSDSGLSWAVDTNKDYMFEEFGSGGINYGNLNPGQNTATLNQQNLIMNTGNATIDIYLYGTDFDRALGGSSIPVYQQQYGTSALNYGLGINATSSSSNTVEVDLDKPISHYYSTSMDDIYWGIGVPTNTMSGVYTGTNTFEAKSD